MSTLVTFHAHPDDEAFLTAGTMARAVRDGHRVVLVIATQGEAGEADLSMVDGGDLGRQRMLEAEASARAIGVHRLVFLGYADSGLGEDVPADAFSRVDVEEAAGRLADILREESADVLTTYDPQGGYGHPDHVQVHHVGRRAAELASTPVVLEATFNRDLLTIAAELAPTLDVELPEDFVPPDTSGWFVPAAEITHTIDVTSVLDRKRASMEAHASQATSSSDTTRNLAMFLQLPEDWYGIAFGKEFFVDRSQPPGASFTDVFATVGGSVAGS